MTELKKPLSEWVVLVEGFVVWRGKAGDGISALSYAERVWGKEWQDSMVVQCVCPMCGTYSFTSFCSEPCHENWLKIKKELSA